MTSTVINPCDLVFYDVNTTTTKKSIAKLLKKHVPNAHWEIRRGKPYLGKNGYEYQRIFITLDKPESVDDFMKQRTFQLNGQSLKVTRSLSKSCPFYNRYVTGLKITIDTTDSNDTLVGKLNENDLKKYFERFGEICKCEWTNADQTEALFTFAHYDLVDKIILENPSPRIKAVKVHLEKTCTANDYITYEDSVVIHVTNLPLRVTTKELSTIFQVPIPAILLNPCFRLEQSHVANGRSSSEAWIKDFDNEKIARALAEKKTGIFVGKNKIQCEAILEPINEDELCKRLENGQCWFMDKCYFKHVICPEIDTCTNQYCWFGHSNKRTTVSHSRPEYRSEDARYRVRFSNLPPNITREALIARLKIDPKSSHHLILQPAELNVGSPRMAYLIRQPYENKLRQEIAEWHDRSFSSTISLKIQCQLEINQDFFDWSDSTDLVRPLDNNQCASPALSIQSTHSNNIKPIPWYPSPVSISSCKESVSTKSPIVEQSHVRSSVLKNKQNIPKKKHTTNSIRLKSVLCHRQPPSDMSSLSTRWRWTNQMIQKDEFDCDEMYWVEGGLNEEENVVTKIYLPISNRTTRIRAQHELVALEHLTEFTSVPKLLNSNVKTINTGQSNNELWTIMKLIDGERLSDYIKCKKFQLREALKLTRQLLFIVKQIHARKVIHRDIQPKNILVKQRLNNDHIDLMLTSFSSAWINNYQWTYTIQDFNHQLGNTFYRMPQFEQQQNENNDPSQHSSTIDTTGVCAILFWLITGHDPIESQNIRGEAPHQLRENLKLIEKQISAAIGFRMEIKIHEHLKRHIILVFDRAFGGPDQQWSADELDYQLQFIFALIQNENEQINYFPTPQNTVLSPSIPFEDPFVYVVSLVHHLKRQFAVRYSKCVRWSTEKKNSWSIQNERIENYDLLIFSCQGKDLSVDIKWNIQILKEHQLLVYIKARIDNKIIIELPMGIWKINEQTPDFEVNLTNFEMEIKILINILFKSIAQ